jgi:hypothetical protein
VKNILLFVIAHFWYFRKPTICTFVVYFF